MSNRTKKAKSSQSKAADERNGQHITRISASSSHRKSSQPEKVAEKKSEDAPKAELVVTETGKTEVQAVDKADQELNTPKKLSREERKAIKQSQKTDAEKPIKSYFLLFRPFVALGRYLRDSWREIRQVRWPNRKATWKMTFAVLVYCALFVVFLTLLDVFFTFIFDKIFNN